MHRIILSNIALQFLNKLPNLNIRFLLDFGFTYGNKVILLIEEKDNLEHNYIIPVTMFTSLLTTKLDIFTFKRYKLDNKKSNNYCWLNNDTIYPPSLSCAFM